MMTCQQYYRNTKNKKYGVWANKVYKLYFQTTIRPLNNIATMIKIILLTRIASYIIL